MPIKKLKARVSQGLSVLAIAAATYTQPAAVAQNVEFSWDTVPLYAHFGRSEREMTHEENVFLAERYDFITLEKAHAIRQYGSSEAGIINGARALKEINPDMTILFYWNGLLNYPLYDAHEEFAVIPDGALRRTDGELDLKNEKLEKYDLSNPDVRAWWIDVAERAIVAGDLDGVFIDALPQISSRPDPMIAKLGEEKYLALEAGSKALLQETSETLGDEKLVIYNGIRSAPNTWEDGGLRYLDVADGVITEHFGHFQSKSREMMAADLERMQTAVDQGKIVIFKGWPGFSWIDKDMMAKPQEELLDLAKEAITFPLASFLIIAGEQSYFNYTWGYRDHHGALAWYPEFDKPLGEPLGRATREGWVYTREFEYASVMVDLNTSTAVIDWRPPTQRQ
ncbi:MAG: putative glycoside hydrolase [Pseudomonadota bacterium]